MINWKNSIENIVLIFVVFIGLGLYTKFFLEPIMKNTVKAAIEKETTAITQTVSQEIDNKFKVYKGGQVDANVTPVAEPGMTTDIMEVNDNPDCIRLSDFTESQQRKIKRWLGE